MLFKKYKLNSDSIELLYLFVNLLIHHHDDDNIIFYNLIEEFIKKQSKVVHSKINFNKMKENIHHFRIKNYIENKQYHKIVPHILELIPNT
jgi:hypothetical protein